MSLHGSDPWYGDSGYYAGATAVTVEMPAVRPSGSAPLSRVLRRGAVLSTFGVAGVQAVSLLATLVLARLLTPEDVGVYAAATVLTMFFVSFADGGMREALVQREHDLTDAADTVFWSTAAGGVLMSAGALAVAPLIGMVFDSGLIGTIAAVTAGMLLVEALTNVPNGLMQRRFDMRRKVVADPIRAVVYAGVTIALAALGHGVWSLVIGNYVALVVWSITCWSLARWRPGRGRFVYGLWREMARFAAPLVVHSLTAYSRSTVESAVVGRQLGEGSLGQYRYGARLAMLPTVAVVEVGSYLLLPAFSRLAGDAARFRAAFVRALRWMCFLAVPTVVVVVLLGEPVVVLLLGEPWREAGHLFTAMGGVAIGVALQAVAGEAIKADGRSRLISGAAVAQLVVSVGLLFALLPYGLVGVGLALSASEILMGLLLLVLAWRILGITLGQILSAVVPPTGGALFGFLLVLLVRMTTPLDLAPGLVVPVVELLVFLVTYLLYLALVDRSLVIGPYRLLSRRLPGRRSPSRPARAARSGRN